MSLDMNARFEYTSITICQYGNADAVAFIFSHNNETSNLVESLFAMLCIFGSYDCTATPHGLGP
jgi:hypothetical protein